MDYLPQESSGRSNPVRYDAPEGALVYLIGQSVNGPHVRRLAAHFILDCLRSYRTPEETAACLHSLEHSTLRDLATDVRVLASEVGLLA